MCAALDASITKLDQAAHAVRAAATRPGTQGRQRNNSAAALHIASTWPLPSHVTPPGPRTQASERPAGRPGPPRPSSPALPQSSAPLTTPRARRRATRGEVTGGPGGPAKTGLGDSEDWPGHL